jgi:hypothetical protein
LFHGGLACLKLACKPHSVQRRGAAAIISLGRLSPGNSCGLPRTTVAKGLRLGKRATSRLYTRLRPCLALLPIGVAWPPALLRAPVVSYTEPAKWLLKKTALAAFPPFHPYPAETRRTVSVALSSRSPHSGYYPASCSMECGLSSTPPEGRAAITRPA